VVSVQGGGGVKRGREGGRERERERKRGGTYRIFVPMMATPNVRAAPMTKKISFFP
jgi:hypothetical protein